MKNLMVANYQPHARVAAYQLKKLMDVQVLNSRELGWQPEDILLVANFPYEFEGVRAHVMHLQDGCLRGSKVFAMRELFRSGHIDAGEIYWSHDLDAWQNHWFDPPDFADIGIAEYSRPKFNGGSAFYRHTARDIVESVAEEILASQADREEPTLNRILRSEDFRDRVTVIDHTFNVGCSGFEKRFQRSDKPVLVAHMHPTNKIAWDTHVNDRNELGASSVSTRLLKLLVEHFHAGTPPQKLVRKVRASH